MKHFFLFVLWGFAMAAKGQDTLFVEDPKDVRYLRYLDSLKAYQISYSVAKSIADTVRKFTGSNQLDNYFLAKFKGEPLSPTSEYFYDFQENVPVTIGRVNDLYKGMKNEAKFPWKFLETQYKKLDSITLQPWGIMQGGELPNVYVYAKPSTTVIFQKIKRYTVVDPTIRFFKKDDGKTKVSYITKYHYSQVWGQLQKIDSVEKLDPITQKHLFY